MSGHRRIVIEFKEAEARARSRRARAKRRLRTWLTLRLQALRKQCRLTAKP